MGKSIGVVEYDIPFNPLLTSCSYNKARMYICTHARSYFNSATLILDISPASNSITTFRPTPLCNMHYVSFDCSTFAAVLTTTYIELHNFHEHPLSGFNLPRITSIDWANIAERNRSFVLCV